MNGFPHQTVPFTRRSYTAFILALWVASLNPYSDSARAQAPPITPSGLNTQVSSPITVEGKTQFNITGGTRPGGGTNLFHSFGEFGVPHNSIANFQNDSGLPTTNILGRVTSGNISNIYGSIQTTDFGNANLFLINPAGFLFGPNATLNVGGMVAFTSADYLKLNDGVRFNATPSPTTDTLLSISPVAAFGFLGSNPGAITVHGSQLAVSKGMGISLIGGSIIIKSGALNNGNAQPAHLSALEGKIQLASTASPGEFDTTMLQPRPNANNTSFKSYGAIGLTPGSSINVNEESTVSIRSGRFALTVNDAVLSTAKNASSPDTINLRRGSSIVTLNSETDPGANIQLFSSQLAMDGATLNSRAIDKGTGGNISVNASSITLVGGAQITSNTDATGSSGSVYVATTDSLTISGFDTTGTVTGTASDLPTVASGIFSNTTTKGGGGALTIVAPRFTVEDTGRIATFTSGDGAGGTVSIQAGEITLKTGGRILTGSGLDFATSETRGNGKAGDITVNADSLLISGVDTFGASSAIRSTPESVGHGGSISITARSITLHDQGMIETIPFGDGRAGDIALTTNTLMIASGGAVQTSGSDIEQSGTITINATDAVTVTGIGAVGPPSRITNENFGNGGTGDITIDSKDLTLTEGAWIRSTTFLDPIPSVQPKIFLHATDSINLTRGADVRVSGFISDVGSLEISAQSITLADHAVVNTGTFANGTAGNVSITSNSLKLASGSQIVSSTLDTGHGGNIFIDVGDMVLSGQFTDAAGVVTPAAILSTSELGSSGKGGNITILADRSVELSNGGNISASTSGAGDAGNILIKANDVSITGGGKITAESTGTGNAGTVTIQGLHSPANSFLLDGAGSNILTSTTKTGTGGNILIDAKDVWLRNGGKVSAETSGTTTSATGGTITIQGDRVRIENRALVTAATTRVAKGGSITISAQESVSVNDSASVSSKSDGLGNAGNISIHAGQRFEVQNGSVTASASQATGGNIDITAADLVHVVNGQISTSVLGGTGTGGNISIDPNTVVLQNSQIVAKAVVGAGGNISITTPLFLADQSSLVNASSQFGLNGTVTIQSPTSNLSGTIGQLSSKPSPIHLLVQNRCAALADGQQSTFILSGHQTFPTTPGGWTPSPFTSLTTEPLGLNESPLPPVNLGGTGILSLRSLNPPGFLVRSFAQDNSTGCRL